MADSRIGAEKPIKIRFKCGSEKLLQESEITAKSYAYCYIDLKLEKFKRIIEEQ